MVPSVDVCFELMNRYGMLDHIKDHSVTVEKVASLIARGLIEAGEALSLRKVTAGALLHDIAKTLCLGTRQDHAAKGEEICLQNHLEEIADIVDLNIGTVKSRLHRGRKLLQKSLWQYAVKNGFVKEATE